MAIRPRAPDRAETLGYWRAIRRVMPGRDARDLVVEAPLADDLVRLREWLERAWTAAEH